MPVKKWHDLKDPVDHEAGRQWSEALDIPDLTTREIEHAVDLLQDGKTDGEISKEVIQRRKR